MPPSGVFDPIVDDPARLNQYFRYDEWITTYSISRSTILDYFALSPFYQKSCLNEVWKIQGIDVANLYTNPIYANIIKESRGIEYVVRPNNSEPQLFIIERRLRNTNNSIATLSIYYCLHGTIYQSPDFRQLIFSRIEQSSQAITRAANHAFAELYAPPGQGGTSGGGSIIDQPQHKEEVYFRAAVDEAISMVTKFNNNL